MDKLKMHTSDLAEENYKKLAEMFPNVVTETVDDDGNVVRAIDKDALMQEINAQVVDDGQERYQFTWPDKRKAVVLANAPIAKTLRFEKEKSVGREGTPGGADSENIYIEGDNLDALKLLQETYLGKVKMIYIDPPYNTGSDAFVYDDDKLMTKTDFSEVSGQKDEEGNLLFDMRINNEGNGRFHTDWLNMLYPRLRIAKDFLREDGVIFISIDDHEVDDLKKICTEIFGEQNFVGCAGRITKKANNQRLLSLDNPVRFIFSHSALREGWDNPNVFQICTLKHGGDSTTNKRQEVGRGLRICVNNTGDRMDEHVLGTEVQDINKLTVIASGGYKDFVSSLQEEIKDDLYERPTKATPEYFAGKRLKLGDDMFTVTEDQAHAIYFYLAKNDYIDEDGHVTDKYRADAENNVLAPLPDKVKDIAEGVHALVNGIFDEHALDGMIEDGHATKIQENALNDNFYKKEFQTLWNYINHKWSYTVHFDSGLT